MNSLLKHNKLSKVLLSKKINKQNKKISQDQILEEEFTSLIEKKKKRDKHERNFEHYQDLRTLQHYKFTAHSVHIKEEMVELFFIYTLC